MFFRFLYRRESLSLGVLILLNVWSMVDREVVTTQFILVYGFKTLSRTLCMTAVKLLFREFRLLSGNCKAKPGGSLWLD